jgi:VanZ family protein
VEPPISIRWGDKLFHTIAYLCLAVLPFFGFKSFITALVGALSMVLLGVAIEFAQNFVPGRCFSLPDMFANTIGVSLGILIGWQLRLNLDRLKAVQTSPGGDEPV